MSRKLNVASALLLVVVIVPAFGGLLSMFATPDVSGLSDGEELLGVTLSQIRDLSPILVDAIELAVQTRGLYLFTFVLFWVVISLIPYRKGEKWAWYAMLVIGATFLSGFLIVNYIGFTLGIYASFWIIFNIILLILWIVGLVLPAKEILGKPSR